MPSRARFNRLFLFRLRLCLFSLLFSIRSLLWSLFNRFSRLLLHFRNPISLFLCDLLPFLDKWDKLVWVGLCWLLKPLVLLFDVFKFLEIVNTTTEHCFGHVADLFINLLLPISLSKEVWEVGVPVHIVVQVRDSPVFEINPMFQKVVLVGVIYQREHRRHWQLTLKHSQVAACVVGMGLGLPFPTKLTQLTPGNLHSHSEEHLHLVFGHGFPLHLPCLLQILFFQMVFFRRMIQRLI